ncbi:OsmC family protein [Peribacillus frigoritolerans]|uniref:OsmC family protein n=1 Tax=Peribacillus frigoritolerans TaxID=450367 RepID=UPI001059D697|nr:OsmC family protein [Peribacillus frigoritolerans]TDL77807.1 OsmC family peroxiredoxin [Peribacillus frigoritolerans]
MEFKMREAGFTADFEYGELHVAGNEEYGFRPYQLMVSSIAVCSGGVLRGILEKKRLVAEDITIQTSVTRNEEEANRIESIAIHYMIKGQDLPEEKVEQSIKLARKNCPMVRSVEDSIQITESFEIIK